MTVNNITLSKTYILAVLFFLYIPTGNKAIAAFCPYDTLPNFTKRKWMVLATHAGIYGAGLFVLNKAWYTQNERSNFNFFNDNKEWLQMDKWGHGWTAYNISRISNETFNWAGFSEKKSAWLAAGWGMGYLTVIEILDAYSTRWGWSWGDIAANTMGAGLFLSQQLISGEQKIQLKFSFHQKKYPVGVLQNRADNLFGKSFYEKTLKDYNAQTYWLSMNLKSFFRKSNCPPWLNIAVGYGANNMYGGFENKWLSANGRVMDYTYIPRERQFYLAPDIDFTKINTSKKWVKNILWALNSFKLPAPALMLNNKGKVKGYFIYF